jgi:hypothetical protein
MLVSLAALAALPVEAAEEVRRRPWYAPDQLKLQLAGNIGFISPGVGYAWFDRRLEADLFFGWVPYAVGGEDIVSFTAKATWLPWEVSLGREWRLRPITAGLQLTYTLGHDYYLLLPDRYPPEYYDFATALRAGIAVGGTLGRHGRGFAREVGVYWELVALDTMLRLWASNREALGPGDVFSLAIGLRVAL